MEQSKDWITEHNKILALDELTNATQEYKLALEEVDMSSHSVPMESLALLARKVDECIAECQRLGVTMEND